MKYYDENTVKLMLRPNEWILERGYPCIDIPDMHGDLKDADTMIRVVIEKSLSPDLEDLKLVSDCLKSIIRDTPTVIESSKRQTTQDMVEVMQAFCDGKIVQLRVPTGKGIGEYAWVDVDDPTWDWNDNMYRVKPEG